MSYENQGNNKNLLIVLSIALTLLIASLLYVWNDKRQMQKQASELIAHKDAIIDQTRKDLEVFRGRNLQLDSLVLSQEDALESKSRIIDSLYRIGRLTGSQLEKLRRENRKLNDLKTVYLRQIDSLVRSNEELRNENTALRQDIEQEKTKAKSLMNENADLYSQVELGSILRATDVNSIGVRAKSSGKEIDADRANKAERIKVSFKILDNKMAKKGAKDIYLRIIGPNGATLTSNSSGKFLVQGRETMYSVKESMNYLNDAMQIVMFFNKEKNEEFIAGDYTSEVYADGYLIGSGKFTLR